MSGSSVDPVITELDTSAVTCRAGGAVGTSDHYAIITSIFIPAMRDELVRRTLWNWEDANWPRIRQAINDVCWTGVLSGDVDIQVDRFNEILLDIQYKYVPHYNEITNPTDQPWIHSQCRTLAKIKNSCLRKF